MDDLDYQGATVLVTGGSAGIGAATAAGFAARGATVYSLDRVPAAEGIRTLLADVTDPAAVRDAVDRILSETGRLDAAICCAGITRDGVVWKLSDEDWAAVIAVNLTGAFHVVRAAVPPMRAAGRGAIALVSSINGERGKFGQSNYAASKAGLIALAKSVARETGRFGIRVNVVAPGLIDTAMTQKMPPEFRQAAINESAVGRAGRPEDIAHSILFLCSDFASHITCHVLRVDGGQYL